MTRLEVSIKILDDENQIESKYSKNSEESISSDDLAYSLLQLVRSSEFDFEQAIKAIVQNAIDIYDFDFKKAFEVKE